jgi:superfamily I DNA and/or RNA helicase
MSKKHITKAMLIDKCLTQSNKYLEYVQDKLKDGGKIYDKINAIEYDEKSKSYDVLLEKKIFDFDRVYFRIGEDIQLIIDKDVEVLKYNEEAKTMTISIKKPPKVQPTLENFTIVSDLTFLIKNLIDWYDKNGNDITFKATAHQFTPDYNILHAITPSDEQKEAIQTILNSAYSYIWGPPGTGKTKVVLSNSAINLTQQGKRILIVAPTNVAIEQAIESIIEHFDTLGYKRSDIFRFGIASARFASLYSQCVINLPKQQEESSLFSEGESDKTVANYKKIMVKRIKNDKIVAMSLDAYIALSFSMDFEFDHIFCDEIGYASIIKTLPLFALKVPVTLLGDHMQLPPIFEGDADEDSILFSRSGIYLEHEINTRLLKRVSLTTTHRFGANLSSLLNHHIYQNGFSSHTEHPTELYYIDSKSKNAEAKNRSSMEEVTAIKNLIHTKDFSNDFAILTPYNAQAFLLKKSLSKNYSDKILTVHKSQGSEYNTVIFSIVDDMERGVRGMFFTDSTNPRSSGLNLINTVVSRVQTKLILVGNYHFWKSQQHQLIGGLFNIAKRYES